MNFRIRKIDTDNHAEFEMGQKAYFEHLERFKKSSNSDLWKFFYWDFFHDGPIMNITVGTDLKTVTMKLVSPNIKRLLPKDDYEYVNAAFICTFYNIIYMKMKGPSSEDWFNSRNELATFLHAEINTSPILDELPNKENFYSLLIQTLVGDDEIWLELVFSQVNVEPEEPLTFSLMEGNPQFEIPVFRPDEK